MNTDILSFSFMDVATLTRRSIVYLCPWAKSAFEDGYISLRSSSDEVFVTSLTLSSDKSPVKLVANFISILLVSVIIALTPLLVSNSMADQQAKSDLAEINHIMYGIFSVNAWKSQISQIIFDEIQKINLKQTTAKLKTTIENQLSAVIDKLNLQVHEANKSSLGGRIKQVLIDLVVDVEVVKKGVPHYADAVIEQINKPETQKLVKQLASKQIRALLKQTHDEPRAASVQVVLDRTKSETIPEATAKLREEIDSRQADIETHGLGIIALAAVLLAWVSLPKHRTGIGFACVFVALVTMLAIGVSLPMIDLEAKISEMSFILVGHKVVFENQILYFQSKSILNVFMLMITHDDLKMKFVGLLLVLFSIVFPTLKMLSSVIYVSSARARSWRLINWFTFKIAKWSMADVVVIAIMMAYIGFNGIVENQFGKMKSLVPADVTFIATNGTSLQIGYYVFIVYVILALLLGELISRDTEIRKTVLCPEKYPNPRRGSPI